MDKRIALITGSSSGIGAGIAQLLADNNIIPIITYNKQRSKAEELTVKLQKTIPESICYHLDLRDEANIKNLANEIANKFGRLDLLICNAGVDYYHESFEEVQLSEWEELFSVKVFGAFLCAKHFLPLLKKSKNPNIITVSASLAERPDPLDPAYSSACAALNNLSLSMAKSLAKENIRTNVICPGPMDTNLEYWKQMKKKDPNIFSKFRSTNPLKKSTEIEDIGDIIILIYNNRLLTGNVIYASGGSNLL